MFATSLLCYPTVMSSPVHDHHHAVQFYSRDEHLVSTVATFIAGGFAHGQPGIVVATPEHLAGVLRELKARLIDVDRARRTRELVVLDAQATLAAFMDGAVPNAKRFEQQVVPLLQQLLKGREAQGIRAYGEMVNLLWQQGLPKAAIQLEKLWNKLANRFGFQLLCGYSMANSGSTPSCSKRSAGSTPTSFPPTMARRKHPDRHTPDRFRDTGRCDEGAD
jgi:hypothetical protein